MKQNSSYDEKENQKGQRTLGSWKLLEKNETLLEVESSSCISDKDLFIYIFETFSGNWDGNWMKGLT